VSLITTYYLILLVRGNATSPETKVSNLEVAGDDVFNLDMFSSFTKDTWLDSRLDRGPFVLQHGDLGLYNIIIDEGTFGVRAFIDWEWSRVVPRQLFIPPTWLTGGTLGLILLHSFYGDLVEELDTFRAILGEREEQLGFGNGLLSSEWAGIHENAASLSQGRWRAGRTSRTWPLCISIGTLTAGGKTVRSAPRRFLPPEMTTAS